MKKSRQPFGEEDKVGTGPWLFKNWMAYKREQIDKVDDPTWDITLGSAVFISYVTAVLEMTIIFRNRMVRVASGGDLKLGNLLELVGKYMEDSPEEITSRTAARLVLSAFEEDDEEEESE
ncbi:MAG: hypothetical protein ABSG17_06365 [Spirochaetia bacterium]|jgi:hypothetical protein